MPNMQERLETAISTAKTDASKLHAVVHGSNTTDITTEGGSIPSLAKAIKTIVDSITGGTINLVTVAQNSAEAAEEAKSTILSNIETALNSALLAQDWANKENGEVVQGEGYSAKYWALRAAAGQLQADWEQTLTTEKDFIKNKPDLATVATSGSYNDLSDKPALSNVATSGSYNDLSNKPTIPSAATEAVAGIAEIATTAETTTGTDDTKIITPLKLVAALASINGFNFQLITSSTTWTVPEGVTEVMVLLVSGAGGGGGGASSFGDVSTLAGCGGGNGSTTAAGGGYWGYGNSGIGGAGVGGGAVDILYMLLVVPEAEEETTAAIPVIGRKVITQQCTEEVPAVKQ